MRTLLRWMCLVTLGLAWAGHASAQGIEVNGNADVLVGSADNCTQPARIKFKKVRDKTPEWKTIRTDGVEPDSARYEILVEQMTTRIKRICKAVARAEGCDCVVKKKDIVDDRGLEVTDITDKVVKKLESDADGS